MSTVIHIWYRTIDNGVFWQGFVGMHAKLCEAKEVLRRKKYGKQSKANHFY